MLVTRLNPKTFIARSLALLEVIFLAIQVKLHALLLVLACVYDMRLTFLKLPLSPLTQNRNWSASGLTTAAFAVANIPS